MVTVDRPRRWKLTVEVTSRWTSDRTADRTREATVNQGDCCENGNVCGGNETMFEPSWPIELGLCGRTV